MQKTTLGWVAALSACVPWLACAQPAQPAEPSRAPQRLPYVSAYLDYKPFRDLGPGDWRALNQTVGAAALRQGHAAGSAEAQAPTAGPTSVPAAAPTTAPASAPKPGMAGHGTKAMPGMDHGHHPTPGGQR